MNKLYRKVKPAAMAEKWKKRYEFCKFNCIHKVSNGKCLTERNFGSCDIGVRLRRHHLFSGNAMGIWETVERAMLASKTNRLKIMRTSGENDQLKTIGLKVPDLAVGRVLEAFRKHDEDVAAGLPGIFGPRNPFNGLFSDDESGKEDEDEDMVFAKRDDDEPMGRNTVDGSAREDSDMDDYLDAELAEEDLI